MCHLSLSRPTFIRRSIVGYEKFLHRECPCIFSLFFKVVKLLSVFSVRGRGNRTQSSGLLCPLSLILARMGSTLAKALVLRAGYAGALACVLLGSAALSGYLGFRRLSYHSILLHLKILMPCLPKGKGKHICRVVVLHKFFFGPVPTVIVYLQYHWLARWICVL